MPDPSQDDVHLVRRTAERAAYDRATIERILDAALVGHVGFVVDERPVVIPMTVWRVDDRLYMHSARKGRFATETEDREICVTVTHVEGFVLSRSAFNHSFNYSSVVVHGRAELTHGLAAKERILRALITKLFPGRWSELRPIKESELTATELLSVPLDRAAAKVRTGPPSDQAIDPDWRVWTGVIPVEQRLGRPLRDPALAESVELPSYLQGLHTQE